MSRSFDYNGIIVAPSTAVKKLKTVKKFLVIDSADRDTVKFVNNGDMVIYLPRVYENVISLRLAAAEFPASPVVVDFKTGATGAAVASTSLYFLIDIEGLGKKDECSVGADRSGYPDGTFAKIPFGAALTDRVLYSDHNQTENIAEYRPAIGKLDRMHIRARLHTQKSTGNYISWPTDYSLTFEVEYLENVFDDFSQFESRITERA